MAIFNTTYNFNQPDMNFGQSLLYGAFGSLTGGGCCGGGYGMGGSIFSMAGMGFGLGANGFGCGFGGYGYGDQIVGMQIGNLISGVLIGGISQALDGRGGNGGSNQETISSKIDTLNNNAKDYLKTLSLTSLNSFNTNSTSSDYLKSGNAIYDSYTRTSTAKEKADNDLKSAEDAINGSNRPISKTEAPTKSSETYTKIYDDYYQEYLTKHSNEENKEAHARTYAQTKQNEAYNADKNLYDTYIAAKKAADEAEKNYNTAKEKYDSEENKIRAAIEALKPLKAEYDELIEKQKKENEAQIYDEADGNWTNRSSRSKVDDYENGECSKPMIRKAFNLFIEYKDKDPNQASKYAKKIINMHDDNQALFDKSYDSAYKQVLSWKNDHIDLFN